MSLLHGFTLVREQTIAELSSQAKLYRHEKTGAEVLALLNADENKAFVAAFRTLPADHTGVAHILEHCVLSGSRKYPLKELFVELIKCSTATYLNASTGSDRTVYPCASQNLQDFYNLMDVYLDVVFHPLLTRQTFEQEGWHYEMENPDAPLNFRGIVFNEMKGAYANPDSLLYRESLAALFPDTVYGKHSGGRPAHIPELSYEQFCQFYSDYYHPANARMFVYGDLQIEQALAQINAAIGEFERRSDLPTVALQPRFLASRTISLPYMASGPAINHKAYVVINWMLNAVEDPVDTLALSIFAHCLLGSPASPLRKALLDSGLGEGLAGWPNFGLRQPVFAAGLKGVGLDNAAAVGPLILDTLTRLTQDGIDPEMIEAGINSLEFGLRENNAHGGQRGINLMERALEAWIFDGDPFALLAFEAPLAELKNRFSTDPRYLENLIQNQLLTNPHRVTIQLLPDSGLQTREETAEKEQLATQLAAMTESEQAAVVTNTGALKIFQETHNTPEVLAALPVLRLTDLEKSARTIPQEKEWVAGCRTLFHPQPTNGIVYLDLGLDARALPQELLPYLTVFGRALLEMGTQTQSMVKLAQRIERTTGGIYPRLFVSETRQADQDGPARLLIGGKATLAKSQELLNILRDILLTVNFNDREHFRQIVLEDKTRRQSRLQSDSQAVTRRIRAHYSTSGWFDDLIGGFASINVLKELSQAIETNWPEVLQNLETIRHLLVNRAGMLVGVTLEDSAWPGFKKQLADFLTELPAQPFAAQTWRLPAMSANEGFIIPSQVNYVGKGANLFQHGYTLHGSTAVIRACLNTTFLYEKIRQQGGAYGGFATFDTITGVFSFASYRDPNLLETLGHYDNCPDFLRQLRLTDNELQRHIVSVAGRMDSYMLPDAKGFAALIRYLVGEDDAFRQQFRDEVFATGPAHFQAFAEALEAVRRDGHTVVMGAEDRLQAANAQHPQPWLQLSQAF